MSEKHDSFETFDFDLQPIRGFPELRWTGKRPFTSTQFFPAQRKEAYGDAKDGWLNQIFWGDNLQVMSHLLRNFRGKVDLIYIDPPFDSKANYSRKIKLKGKSVDASRSSFEEAQYHDMWNNDGYLQFMYERLVLCRELLSNTGSIYLHCDYRRSHYLKIIMDEVFGLDQFINEIVWVRTNAHNMKSKGYTRSNDHILFYTKTSEYTFNEQFNPISEEQLSRYKKDADGRLYTGQDLTFSSESETRRDTWRGTTPSPGRAWGASIEQREEWWEQGLILKKRDGTPRLDGLKVYLDDAKGTALSTMWDDVSRVGNTSSERLGYPTQKPEALLDRVIEVSSNPGDLVFDFFMGSGTTQTVAMRKGRRFLGADINLGSVEITVQRLLNEARTIVDEENSLLGPSDASLKRFTGFELHNVNNYDIFRNPVEAKELIKEAMELQPLPTSSVFDGQRDHYLVKVMPVNRIATRADLNEVINGMDFKAFEHRQAEAPSKIVERIMLVCMGHEPDLGPELVKAAKPFNIEVEVVDLIRDKSNLHFKRQSDAKLASKDGYLEIVGFYPLNLLQKLSMDADTVEDWRQLVETIKIDWNYDGAVLSPELIDAPGKDELVSGRYPIPKDAATIRVKITDLLSESWEGEIENA
ncbi:site-specific DNA-methyltransferase [uncultured Roseibium sp.]|uniref:site-specific DNA-methyltransferase n=1 Tax=uncultured Roseibium sp. TaxID=1936171 RepID=UPI0026217BDF|nr:site-specific DNA-methyltransferase [uncultured Roseibium sp.]